MPLLKADKMLETVIEIADKAGRLDVFLSSVTDYSRNRIQNLIRDGGARVNGRPAKANTVLKPGDEVLLKIPPLIETAVLPENIPLDVLYEDGDLLVLNKPRAMVVHPAPGHDSGTLVNALLYRVSDLSGIGGEKRPGIVHRLDRMTSGLMVIAKNDPAHQELSRQFSTHAARRSYIAIVDGNLKEDKGTVDAPVGRHPSQRQRMAVVPNGREAVTHWEVLERYGTNTLLRLTLETGRTHQIRVHMAYVRHPVTGDDVYGAKKQQLGLDGQALHGYRLEFTHPTTAEQKVFFAPPPDIFLQALRKLNAAYDLAQLCGGKEESYAQEL